MNGTDASAHTPGSSVVGLDDEALSLAAWLRLSATPGLGPAAARRLLAAAGSAPAAVDAGVAPTSPLKPAERSALAASAESVAAVLAVTRAWLDGAPGWRHVLALDDPRYPRGLLEIPDPPLLLYAEGALGWLDAPSALAMVGSRHPTAQGRDHARAFARELAGAGVVVVSGLALGVDGAAHEGALEAAPLGGAGTVAVVGTGLDQVYPRAHQALARRIIEHGLILSEYPLGTPPRSENFPRRNRLIAALSRGTLVVEAALQSGSLITARMAVEAGREVFAIPGSIHAPQARGCHALIRQGAKLVESVADIFEELPGLDRRIGSGVPQDPVGPPSVVAANGAEPEEDAVLSAMGFDPVALDLLCARTGRDPAQLSAHLLELELTGHIARLPGQRWQRRMSG